jgi:hypothetical protein
VGKFILDDVGELVCENMDALGPPQVIQNLFIDQQLLSLLGLADAAEGGFGDLAGQGGVGIEFLGQPLSKCLAVGVEVQREGGLGDRHLQVFRHH